MKLPILLFDPDCPLCVRFTQALKLIDKNNKITMMSLYTDEIYNLYPTLIKEECEKTLHLITETEQILQGEQVLTYLIQELPAVEKFSWLVKQDSSQKALKAFYNKVNEVRKIIKKQGCHGCGPKKDKEL
jgi:predicted DCC family thiol-disulfide oxidoreductase YuxK